MGDVLDAMKRKLRFGRVRRRKNLRMKTNDYCDESDVSTLGNVVLLQ